MPSCSHVAGGFQNGISFLIVNFYDESGYLKEGAKFYLTTKRFELQGIVKNFPIYNLIVEMYLFPFDRSMVFNLGVRPRRFTAKMSGICSYLLFLFSIGAVMFAQLLSDDFDIMAYVTAYIINTWHHILKFVQLSNSCHSTPYPILKP